MAALDELNLSRPGKKARRLAPEPKNTSEPFNPSDQEIFEKLRRAGASAVALRIIPKVDPEDTDAASEDEEMYTFLRHPSSARPPTGCGIAAAMVLALSKSSALGP
ncbi:hypothetical protein HPB52_021725 [Rhipicephalus sanguineus]|uniref:Uncharacterized protein n=1 Tax=Rhipicephalus sanguineus TaxID=34632 RepID=A0A9D4Q8L0_RHISA|nr:hypothetical protein HPB52_021725 [Rhipicephalus sanguineus]